MIRRVCKGCVGVTPSRSYDGDPVDGTVQYISEAPHRQDDGKTVDIVDDRLDTSPWLGEVERSETPSVPRGERSDPRGPSSRVRRAANAIADSNPRKRAQRVLPGSNSAVTFLLLSRRCASPGDDDAPDGSGDESGSAEQTAEGRHVVNEVKMPRIG